MTFPAIATLQELELGTVTTIDEDIYKGSIYGSSLMGKAQGMYVASSENGSSHMMAMTTSFLSNDYEDSLRFFGVHRGDVFESHIAVIGGTGKYHDANGYATVKIVNETANKSEGAYKILSFNVYLARLLDEVSQVADASSETDEPVVAPVVAPVATLPPATVTAPDSDVAPAADPSVPADTVAPPADLPAEPEPDSAPVIAPAGSVAPPTDLTDTGAAPVANAAPGRVVTGIVATSDANNLPFSMANNQIFPINGRVPLNTINKVVNNNNYPFLAGLNGQQQANTVLQNTGNNNIVNGGNNQPFVTAGQLPVGLSLQQLMFGSINVVDNEITEGHELGSAVLGKTQGFYLTSSSDGTSHTLALTALFHGGEHNHKVDDSISFFGIHRTATLISHIAIIGGTGKYENAQGFSTIETLPHVDQHTTDGVETITHFTVYITP
ncbi:hypothetical protein K7X08_017095 [Anisodus acutangulus]|uniref:Dirigent protein n=1 Tax=Anisodus acutangulus TaxID=402998 RepID=A0A9Q1LTW6_9SOLA|nr:hypothetical protein K7X08_017095 [Anisodus acutangulus]